MTGISPTRFLIGLLFPTFALGLLSCAYTGSGGVPDPIPPVDPPSLNPSQTIQIENAKPGTRDWQLSTPHAHGEIEGYASATSVNRGENISFFVNTEEAFFTLQVFRMGWYGGTGGREMTAAVSVSGIEQPAPTRDPDTLLMQCHWTNPYVLHIPDNPEDPSDWASGIYVVKLTAGTSGEQSYIIFVVRDDKRPSALLFQSSVTTYEAYNHWGGASLYSHPRAYAVSFDRPYAQGNGSGDFLNGANWEYSLVRFLEREGYDVTYSTDIDTHERESQLLLHRAFLSTGHDEYWSWQMRMNVEEALAHGVNLAFFGANAVDLQIRLEPSTFTGDQDRTIVCYKVADLDPISKTSLAYLTTVKFRLPPVNRPQEELLGVMYEHFLSPSVTNDVIVTDASDWVFENTGLHDGDHLVGLLGHEFDRSFSEMPAGKKIVAHSPYRWEGHTQFSDMTEYTAPCDGVGDWTTSRFGTQTLSTPLFNRQLGIF